MKLIFIYGAPAAGKLTVATELASQTGYKLLDNHKAIDYLVDIFPREDHQHDRTRSKLGRRIRLDTFEAVAQAGVNLITTFAPISAGMYDFMRDARTAVESQGGEICFVQLAPPQATMEERVLSESRKGHKIDTVERWRELLVGNPGAFEPFPDVEHLIIDNSEISPAETAQKIIQHYDLR
jgi:hypothetical protein